MPGAGYAPRSFARVEPFTRSPHPPLLRGFPYPSPGYRNPPLLFPVASRLPSSRDSRSRPPAIRQGPHLRIQQPHPPCRHTVTACSSVLPPVSISPLPSQPPPCDAPDQDQACPIPISAPFSARLGSPDASSRPSAAYSAIKCLSYKHRYDPLPHHSTNFLEGKFAYLKI